MLALLGTDGVIALPTAPGPAIPRATPPDQVDDWRARLLSLTCVAGLAGVPQVRRGCVFWGWGGVGVRWGVNVGIALFGAWLWNVLTSPLTLPCCLVPIHNAELSLHQGTAHAVPKQLQQPPPSPKPNQNQTKHHRSTSRSPRWTACPWASAWSGPPAATRPWCSWRSGWRRRWGALGLGLGLGLGLFKAADERGADGFCPHLFVASDRRRLYAL